MNKIAAKDEVIAYYRVSTARQGASGLGLDAQKATVQAFIGKRKLLASYIEVESGRKKSRPELDKALAHCKKTGAKLVIAKLDRLARNVLFISRLLESKIEFIACDLPEANKLMLHIMAAIAEHETELISQRTKAALAQAKLRGVELGAYGKILAKHNREKAITEEKQYTSLFATLNARLQGNLNAIARELNKQEIKTKNGGQWYPAQVKRTLDRLELALS